MFYRFLDMAFTGQCSLSASLRLPSFVNVGEEIFPVVLWNNTHAIVCKEVFDKAVRRQNMNVG